MNLKLTQKERSLLEDQKTHEQICIEKYTSYARLAKDPELAQMFNTFAQQERHHLDTINQMLAGTVPNMQQNQSQNQQGQQMQQPQNQQMQQGQEPAFQAQMSDADLCTDLLMTEKYVSGVYNMAIFEFTDTNARQALNHIQKEEQQHGEGLFQYMQAHGMYNPQ